MYKSGFITNYDESNKYAFSDLNSRRILNYAYSSQDVLVMI